MAGNSPGGVITFIADAEMEARSRRTIDSLGLPARFSLEELIAAISVTMGRPIQMVALPSGVGREVSGAVGYRPPGYVVWYPGGAEMFYQRGVQVHELAHIACGHVAGPALERHYVSSALRAETTSTTAERLKELMPDLRTPIDALWGGPKLFRCQMSGPAELEAEFTATLLYGRLTDSTDEPEASAQPRRRATGPNVAERSGGRRSRVRGRRR